MKQIHLQGQHGSGQYTTVDAEDYNALMQLNSNFSVNSGGYAQFWNKGKPVLMHRYIMGAQKGSVVDHIDGNRLNNCKSNLRLCSASQNSANNKKRSGCSSKYKGVSWQASANKYKATCSFNKKTYYLGLFADEDEAALAYNEKAKELHGEFAVLNEVGVISK